MGKTGIKNRSRLLSLLLAAVVLTGLIVPALAEIEWPTKIERFERYNPVYSGVVEPGTAKEDLGLPEYLRAVIPLDELELDPASFAQAEPEVDMSDGYTHYDYYYYGYVAPKDVDKLYENGELAIYAIYYADQENPETVGEVAYRVYGSINGSENVWFACDEAGNISGVVLDIPVTWEDGGYDPETEGEYLFTANITGYTYGEARPFAKITVKNIEAADGSHDHGDEESPKCTCGAQPDKNGVITHTADCPLYAEEIHCTCEVGEDTYSDEHAEDCPYFEKEELLCTCDLQTNEKGDGHDVSCPCYVRKAVDCHCGPNGEPIDADNFPWAHQEDCIHFSPIECMCREQLETVVEDFDDYGNKIGEHNELVAGEFSHVHDPNNMDCPLYGKDTVTIQKLDENSLSSQVMGSTTSVMAKEDAERIVASQQAEKPSEDNAAQQTEQDFATNKEEQQDGQAPARKQNAVLFAVQPDLQPEEEQAEILYPALGEIEIVAGSEQSGNGYDFGMELLSLNGGGALDTASDDYMRQNSPTSGNLDEAYYYENANNPVIPGTWIDYINTIWVNKGIMSFSWMPDNQTEAYHSWKWSGTTASSSSGTVTDSATRIPTKSGATWIVYSGEQLRYALSNFASGDTIRLRGNINLDGDEKDWNAISFSNKSLSITGEGNTIYNLGLYDYGSGKQHLVGAFISGKSTTNGGYNFTLSDLSIVSSKNMKETVIGDSTSVGGALFGMDKYRVNISNIKFENLLDYQLSESTHTTQNYSVSGALFANFYDGIIQNVQTQGLKVYQDTHLNPFGIYFSGPVQIKNSYIIDALYASIGFHSSGFMSCCSGNATTVENCFVSQEAYGAAIVTGFAGFNIAAANCYATGRLEGYQQLGGFVWNGVNAGDHRTIENCYSTVLVGLRSKPRVQAGFITNESMSEKTATLEHLSNCYAAGEVGNFDTDLVNNTTVQGGFVDLLSDDGTPDYTHCYYDKQTTAMREWVTGTSKTLSGVTGVLTTDTQNASGRTIHGLVGQPGSPGEQGFTGFSDNTQWVYHDQHYPQLDVFANATSTDWSSVETANLVRAYSAASTATVFLNTWSEGYDWDENGVRTQEKVSYDRADDGISHKGNSLTYDTVREITTDFKTSYSQDHHSNWEEMVEGGAQVTCGEIIRTDTIHIDGQGNGTVNHPGMNWFEIQATVNGQTGKRPLRLIAFMMVEAGENKTVYAGERYNHREDVDLHMIDKLTDNLVIGLDDDKIWATSSRFGYPESRQYYNVQTQPTEFSASKNAYLRTEIWLAEQNPDGSYVQDTENHYGYTDGTNKLVPGTSVKVTGPGTGAGATLDEQKWNGEIPLYPDTSMERKYIISYYWVLDDGRYNEDYKIITIEPGQYDITVDVLNLEDDTPNSTLIYPAAGADSGNDLGYTLPGSTASHGEALDVLFTTNSAAAWKKLDGDVKVEKLQVNLYTNDADKTLMGTATVEGEIVDGSTITIPTTYYYTANERDTSQNIDREVTKQETVDVTYTIVEKKDSTGKGTGEYYLRLNKLANLPDWEPPAASAGTNDAAGIPAGTAAYINDTQFNTEITLWVESGADFEFIKVDKEARPFGEGEAEFQLYSCSHVHDASCGGLDDPSQCHHVHDELATSSSADHGCWAVEGETVQTAQTDANGKVRFESLSTGEYMLAETRTKEGMQLPQGQWLIQVDAVKGTIGITAKGEMPPAFKTETENGVRVLKLPNYPIWTTPSSGGMGTILFTVGGIALIGVAVILLIVTRKKKDRKNR